VPEAILIFLMPPGIDALRERLRGRGTEDEEAMERRIRLAEGEIARAGSYDYIVVNDHLEIAFETLKAIILAARHRAARRFGDPARPPGGATE
jgi:guanylate kinase